MICPASTAYTAVMSTAYPVPWLLAGGSIWLAQARSIFFYALVPLMDDRRKANHAWRLWED